MSPHVSAKSCKVAHCKSCGGVIFWALTIGPSGGVKSRMPVDYDPVENGNIEVVDWTRTPEEDEWTPVIRTLKKGEAESPTLLEPPPRFRSHFASCPDSPIHRKDRK